MDIDWRLIDVKEVSRRNYDFILYKSMYYANEYFVEIVFEQSFASWSKSYKLSDNEAEIASQGDEKKITEMIFKMRRDISA